MTYENRTFIQFNMAKFTGIQGKSIRSTAENIKYHQKDIQFHNHLKFGLTKKKYILNLPKFDGK